MRGRSWTKEEDATLTAEWEPGAARKLAAKLNRTPYSIFGRVSTLGLTAQHQEMLAIERRINMVEAIACANS